MDSPDDLDSGAAGMGPRHRGPSFLPWSPPGQAAAGAPIEPQASAHATTSRPVRSTFPTVLSLLVIALVAAVVGVASLAARHADTHVASPIITVAPVPLPNRDDQIDFTSSTGSGKLIMISRSWISSAAQNPTTGPPTTGSYLRIEVELICASGTVDYDPYNFQAFDQGGRLFELAVEGTGRSPLLEVGTLQAGERVRGTLAFDMPRGEATLLMSDESDQTVTALRVPD